VKTDLPLAKGRFFESSNTSPRHSVRHLVGPSFLRVELTDPLSNFNYNASFPSQRPTTLSSPSLFSQELSMRWPFFSCFPLLRDKEMCLPLFFFEEVDKALSFPSPVGFRTLFFLGRNDVLFSFSRRGAPLFSDAMPLFFRTAGSFFFPFFRSVFFRRNCFFFRQRWMSFPPFC